MDRVRVFSNRILNSGYFTLHHTPPWQPRWRRAGSAVWQRWCTAPWCCPDTRWQFVLAPSKIDKIFQITESLAEEDENPIFLTSDPDQAQQGKKSDPATDPILTQNEKKEYLYFSKVGIKVNFINHHFKLKFVDSCLYFFKDENNFIYPLFQVESWSDKKRTESLFLYLYPLFFTLTILLDMQ